MANLDEILAKNKKGVLPKKTSSKTSVDFDALLKKNTIPASRAVIPQVQTTKQE